MCTIWEMAALIRAEEAARAGLDAQARIAAAAAPSATTAPVLERMPVPAGARPDARALQRRRA
jgi:hypothetical protein